MHKTVPQVYRDCLRLIDHLAGRSRKGDHMRALVARQFRKHADEKDLDRIESLKRNAMGGLANYLTMESLGKLEAQNGATNSGRDPARLAAAVRKSLGRDALPEGEASASSAAAAAAAAAADAAATPVPSAGSSFASSAQMARAEAASRQALRDSIPEADVTPMVSSRVAELQAQLRANKNLRLELEKRAREGKSITDPL